MSDPFRIALTADFYHADGSTKFKSIGVEVIDDAPSITYAPFAEHRATIGADQLAGVNGVVVLTPSVTAESLTNADDLLAVGRFGVGYDAVDLDACTANDVVAFITAGAVDRSVAEAVVGWMIALTHHTRAKDALVREGRWDDRAGLMGCELRGRTFGAVGLGGIARETLRLLGVFGMHQPIAFDPFMDESTAARFGVKLVTVDELMAEADFVSVHCPLTDDTHGLIGEKEIARMKSNAYLLNTARGGIIDEDALFEALSEKRIAGAALDCFVDEPVTKPHRFGELDNVILAPHCIAWTDELFRDIGHSVCGGMVDLANGKLPRGIVNPAVLERDSFKAKFKRLQLGGGA